MLEYLTAAAAFISAGGVLWLNFRHDRLVLWLNARLNRMDAKLDRFNAGAAR